MLRISRKAHSAAGKLKVESEKLRGKGSRLKLSTLNSQLSTLYHELWKGQCNDAYWHGIFGGLYLPHLRSSLYRHLLAAESMAEEILGSNSQRVKGSRLRRVAEETKGQKVTEFIEEGDFDCDGFKDICISTGGLTAFLSEDSGALIELSVKKKQINVLDTLTRRPEAYHSKISEAAHHNPGETKTIHERICVKEAGLLDYLVYDNYRRASLLDHFLDYNIKLDDLIKSDYHDKGDFIGSPYDMERIIGKNASGVKLAREGLVSGTDMRLEKSVLFRKSEMRVDYLLEGKYNGIFAPEFNLSFLGSPYALVNLGSKSFFIRDKGRHSALHEFYVEDKFLNLTMAFTFDESMELWHYPVETISLSEHGVERLYQGTAFLFMKRLDFNGDKRLGFTIKFGENK